MYNLFRKYTFWFLFLPISIVVIFERIVVVWFYRQHRVVGHSMFDPYWFDFLVLHYTPALIFITAMFSYVITTLVNRK